MRYLRVANVFDGWIDTSDVLEMPFTGTERERFLLRTGDILLNEGQSLELVGRSAIYNGELSPCCFQNTLVRFRAGPSVDPRFAQIIFRRYLETGVFASIALQTTSIAHLGAGRFANLEMPVPSRQAQEAIAAALGDADGLVESLERLIGKKRRIKLGAMQELLTGKRRLPGFEGEWETRSLRSVATITMGQSPPSQFYNRIANGLPLIQGNADIIDRRTIARVWTSMASKRCAAGDLLLTVRAPVGEVATASEPACLGRGVCALSPKIDQAYLFHALVSAEPRWKALEQGSTFTSANSTHVGDFEVAVPVDLGEQRAIAAILSDMDAEIAALEARLTKARRLKRGMMQQLLTGRIRLLPNP